MNPEDKKPKIRELAEPINLAALKNNGVISKEGDWYRIHRFEDLPEQASNQIARLEQDEKGIKVKFIDQAEYETHVQYLDEQSI